MISSEFGHDQAGAVERFDLGGAHADAAHVALLVADDDAVADLDRPLDQQDQPRHEVVDDRLQAEADADRQRAGDDGKIGDVEPGVGHREQRCERNAGVAHHRVDGIGDARVQAGLHGPLAQPALDQPRGEQERDEQDDAEQDARERDLELTDLEAEEQRFEALADVRAGEPPLQHQERQGADDQREGQGQLGQPRQLMTARGIEAELLLQEFADGEAALRRLARDGANGQVAEPAQENDDAGQHELLGRKTRKRDIAQQCRDDDADGDDPKRHLEPARLVA